MWKHDKKLNSQPQSFVLKPKHEQKYIRYLKQRYGKKRVKSFCE